MSETERDEAIKDNYRFGEKPLSHKDPCDEDDVFGCALKVSHCFLRKDVQELGMTLIVDARKKAPPPHLYKALLMAQVQITIGAIRHKRLKSG